MKKFITLSQIERKNLIQKVAFDLGIRFDIVEKDIWVCYVLEKLSFEFLIFIKVILLFIKTTFYFKGFGKIKFY
jgi:hypothetical protein